MNLSQDTRKTLKINGDVDDDGVVEMDLEQVQSVLNEAGRKLKINSEKLQVVSDRLKKLAESMDLPLESEEDFELAANEIRELYRAKGQVLKEHQRRSC